MKEFGSHAGRELVPGDPNYMQPVLVDDGNGGLLGFMLSEPSKPATINAAGAEIGSNFVVCLIHQGEQVVEAGVHVNRLTKI
jgi:hypothetical protein